MEPRQSLGNVDPKSLVEARHQAHWGAQVVAAAGASLLDARDDFSHANLGWVPRRAAVASRPLVDHAGLRAALVVPTLELVLLDPGDDVVDRLELGGKSVAAAMSWLSDALPRYDGTPLRAPLERPTHDLPQHGVAAGGRFATADLGPALAELAQWFGYADEVVHRFADATDGSSEVRVWPHHFDLATLVTIAPAAEDGGVRTVGFGYSPGDASYAEPYFYFTPWPVPENPELEPLDGGGSWHTEGWLGAVLTGSAVIENGAEQNARVRRFVESAFAAARAFVVSGR